MLVDIGELVTLGVDLPKIRVAGKEDITEAVDVLHHPWFCNRQLGINLHVLGLPIHVRDERIRPGPEVLALRESFGIRIVGLVPFLEIVHRRNREAGIDARRRKDEAGIGCRESERDRAVVDLRHGYRLAADHELRRHAAAIPDWRRCPCTRI